MTYKTLLYVFLVFSFQVLAVPLLAQDITVTGKVTLKTTGAGLEGVTINIKETSIATITDKEGNFRINARPGAVLVASYIGMAEQEVTIPASGSVSIVMEAKTI